MASIKEMLAKRMAKAGMVSPENAGPGWAALSDHLTSIGEQRTGRLDIDVAVAPGATSALTVKEGEKAPAGGYDFDRSKIIIDGDRLPASPDELDMSNPEHFAALAGTYGEFVHQLAHAEHSKEMRPALEDKKLTDLTGALEDLRIEAAALADRPRDIDWLRTAASADVLCEGAPTTKRDAAVLATQTLGRVKAGTMEEDDVADLREVFDEVLGEELMESLDKLWDDAIALPDGSPDELLGVARGVGSLLVEEEEESSEEGDPDSADGGDLSEGASKALGEAAEEAMDDVAEDSVSELAGDETEEGADDLEEALDAIDRTEDEATPSKASPAKAGGGRSSDAIREDHLITWDSRIPTPEEVASRKALAQRLKKARWRDRTVKELKRELPPGRLHSRSAVSASAEKASGRLPEAKPWRAKEKRMAQTPKIRVGIAVDVAASMGSLPGLSGIVWSLTGAVRDCGSTVVSCAYGDSVREIVGPGKSVGMVTDFTCDSGAKQVALAVEYLERKLSWSVPGSPGLLIVTSDGCWGDTRKEELDERLTELHSQGIRTLCVGIGKSVCNICAPHSPGFNEDITVSTIDQLARHVGDIYDELLKTA